MHAPRAKFDTPPGAAWLAFIVSTTLLCGVTLYVGTRFYAVVEASWMNVLVVSVLVPIVTWLAFRVYVSDRIVLGGFENVVWITVGTFLLFWVGVLMPYLYTYPTMHTTYLLAVSACIGITSIGYAMWHGPVYGW